MAASCKRCCSAATSAAARASASRAASCAAAADAASAAAASSLAVSVFEQATSTNDANTTDANLPTTGSVFMNEILSFVRNELQLFVMYRIFSQFLSLGHLFCLSKSVN